MPKIHPPDKLPLPPVPLLGVFTFQLVIGIVIKLAIVLGDAALRAEMIELPDTALPLLVVVKSTSVTFAAMAMTDRMVTLTVFA